MKKFMLICIILHFNPILCLNAQINVRDHFVDSLLLTNLKGHIDLKMSTDEGISNTYIDSSRYTIIAGRKAYYKISKSKAIRPDSLVKLFKHVDIVQKYKIYAYIFEYLFQIGLDFKYDYYTQFLFINESSTYLDRFRTKEYYDKKKLLFYFFDIYQNYRYFIFSDNNFNSEGIQIINNILSFGDFKFPISCENVLKDKSVLNRSTFEGNFSK